MEKDVAALWSDTFLPYSRKLRRKKIESFLWTILSAILSKLQNLPVRLTVCCNEMLSPMIEVSESVFIKIYFTPEWEVLLTTTTVYFLRHFFQSWFGSAWWFGLTTWMLNIEMIRWLLYWMTCWNFSDGTDLFQYVTIYWAEIVTEWFRE